MIKKKKAARDDRDRSRYRRLVRPGDLVSFSVTVKETDLFILAGEDLGEAARELVMTSRYRLEEYIAAHPDFVSSLEPLPEDPLAPPLVREMLRAGISAGVGPMAAVAGAIAEETGRGLSSLSRELAVENGGDLFLMGEQERTVALFTGDGKLDAGLGLRIRPGGGIGIGTSSGTFGHSLSLGEASTATVVAPSAALADASATAVGNAVQGKHGVEKGIELARGIQGIAGVIVVQDGRVGAWGDLELVETGKGAGER